jgi:hypothetical protein
MGKDLTVIAGQHTRGQMIYVSVIVAKICKRLYFTFRPHPRSWFGKRLWEVHHWAISYPT